MANYNEKTKTIEPHNLVADKTMFKDLAEEYGVTELQVDAAFIAASEGVNKIRIAERVGRTRMTIYNWFKNPKFLRLYGDLCGAILKGMQGKALKRMDQLLESENENVGYRSAKFVITTNLDVVEGVDISQRDTIDELLNILSQPIAKGDLVVNEKEGVEFNPSELRDGVDKGINREKAPEHKPEDQEE